MFVNILKALYGFIKVTKGTNMKKLTCVLFTFLAVFQISSAWSVLPPLYTTLDQFKAVVNDEQLPKKLDSGEAILAIVRIQDGFKIVTNKHRLIVDVVPEKTDKIGPMKFHLVFHDPVPIEAQAQ